MIILAMHGILTGREDITWPERFETYAWLNFPDFRVLVDHYAAGPWPRINWMLGNPKLARGQAIRMLNWVQQGKGGGRLALVGHSNGCEIVRQTAMMLAAAGAVIDCLVLIAPPIHPDLDRNGLQDLLDNGSLGRVVCYASPIDKVMARRLSWNPVTWFQHVVRWPYGNAGRVGLDRGECLTEDQQMAAGTRVATRWWPRYGHSTWFSPAVSHQTFDLILSDAQLDPQTLRLLAETTEACGPCAGAKQIESANRKAATHVPINTAH